MNRYRLSKAGIDATEALRRLNDDKELYVKLLSDFPKDPNYGILRSAIAANDAKAAFQAAHALKGISGNLSMRRLYEDVTPLVEALRSGDLTDVEALMTPVSEDYEEILRALE